MRTCSRVDAIWFLFYKSQQIGIFREIFPSATNLFLISAHFIQNAGCFHNHSGNRSISVVRLIKCDCEWQFLDALSKLSHGIEMIKNIRSDNKYKILVILREKRPLHHYRIAFKSLRPRVFYRKLPSSSYSMYSASSHIQKCRLE